MQPAGGTQREAAPSSQLRPEASCSAPAAGPYTHVGLALISPKSRSQVEETTM